MPLEEPTSDSKCKFFASFVDSDDEEEEEQEESLEDKSDKLVDNWLKWKNISYNKFRYEGTDPFFVVSSSFTIEETIEKFDTMKYFREEGRVKHPIITLLARTEFAYMDNGGFQERVFSTVGNAQSSNQGRKVGKHLEKRDMLAHNKEHRSSRESFRGIKF